MVSKFDEIPWNEIIKKEARGIDDADFGEIQSVDTDHVITQKGIIDKEIFSFPKNLAQGYDGDRIWFKVTEEEARNSYLKSQNMDDYSRGTETETTTNDESLSNITENEENEDIPLKSEELDVNKRVVVDEKVITKKPVKETKTIEVQLNREEIESIERRPPSIESEGEAENPIQSPEEIKIP
jgi:stress response protein YsnF